MYQERIYAEKVAQAVKEMLPEKNVKIVRVDNNNVTLTGLCISLKEDIGDSTIYINFSNSIEDEKKRIVDLYEKIKHDEEIMNTKTVMQSKEEVLKRVQPYVAHEINGWVRELPGRRVAEDLVLYYCCVVRETEEEFSERYAVKITSEMAKELSITEKELYEAAKNNFKPQKKDMADMGKLAGEEILDSVMFVLSNKQINNGAAGTLAYKFFLEELAKEWGNLIIIPSSVHECIVLREEGTEVDYYADLLRLTNMYQLAEDEVLSYSLYLYDKESKEITIYL